MYIYEPVDFDREEGYFEYNENFNSGLLAKISPGNLTLVNLLDKI